MKRQKGNDDKNNDGGGDSDESDEDANLFNEEEPPAQPKVEPAPAEPEIVKQEVAEPVNAEADNLTVTNDVA